MGKADGFLLVERQENSYRDISERIQDYEEIYGSLKQEDRRNQASRCMNCGVPFCQSGMVLNRMYTGCPLHNLIPEWNDSIYLGNEQHGLSRLLRTNPFPEFTGRVCPALCEKACLNGKDTQPVTVHDNELYLIEYAYANGFIRPQPPKVCSGRHAAVIGSGPAGLAAAYRLNRRGHSVTVYERDDEIGGLLMYGIPNMKLDKKVIQRRRRIMEEEGIRFVTGVEAGTDISFEELKETYDAIILACGAKKERIPEIEGMAGTEGVIKAVDFLKACTKALPELPETNAKGKHVVIIGGGDTGNDCVAVSVRQGCASVTQIEMMPEPPHERGADNPWPEWPKVFKTDYGQQEAAYAFGHDPRIFSSTVTKLISNENKITAAEIHKVHFENGKLSVGEEAETIPCDLLIIAAGFTGCENKIAEAAGICLSERNTAATPEGSYACSVEGIFACGDMHRGQSLVVHAIKEGMECAKEADEYMMGYTNLI